MQEFERFVNLQIHLMAALKIHLKMQNFIGLQKHQKFVDFDRRNSDLVVAMADYRKDFEFVNQLIPRFVIHQIHYFITSRTLNSRVIASCLEHFCQRYFIESMVATDPQKTIKFRAPHQSL